MQVPFIVHLFRCVVGPRFFTKQKVADRVVQDVVFHRVYQTFVWNGRDRHAIAAQHRVGYLGIGGVALYVAVSASHRRQAFDCASDLVERVKAELPIWKKQYLVDGSHEWSQCP